jgi:hypothetical protein
VKVVGGLDYRYALRGDGQLITKAVPPDEQRKALKAVLSTIQPEALTLPQRIVDLIPPRPEGYAETRELFKGRTGLTFDPVGAAESAASISVGLLLNPERATRLVQHQAEDSRQLGLSEVLDALVASTWQAKDAPGLSGRVQAAARLAALRQLMSLAVDERASGEARGLALGEVQKLKVWLAAQPKSAAGTLALQQIGMFERDPKQMSLPRPMEAPPGMPIGMACDWE